MTVNRMLQGIETHPPSFLDRVVAQLPRHVTVCRLMKRDGQQNRQHPSGHHKERKRPVVVVQNDTSKSQGFARYQAFGHGLGGVGGPLLARSGHLYLDKIESFPPASS